MEKPVPTPQTTRKTAHNVVEVLKSSIRNRPDPTIPTAVPMIINGVCMIQISSTGLYQSSGTSHETHIYTKHSDEGP